MARMFFIKMRILRLVLKIFDVSKYSTQSIPTKKLPAPLLADHYPNFKIVKEEDFQKIVDLIKHRPRKSLDYRTPHEIFFGASEPVALQI
jgi:hypothetical protein